MNTLPTFSEALYRHHEFGYDNWQRHHLTQCVFHQKMKCGEKMVLLSLINFEGEIDTYKLARMSSVTFETCVEIVSKLCSIGYVRLDVDDLSGRVLVSLHVPNPKSMVPIASRGAAAKAKKALDNDGDLF